MSAQSIKFLTAKQAAERAGTSQSAVLKLARKGQIRGAEKMGWIWLIPVGQIDNLIELVQNRKNNQT